MPAKDAEALARPLLDDPAVLPIGLGARDSLRLEAGLCLYGHDIDTTTTPVEAGLNWSIQKSRRTGGARAGGFPGADVDPQATRRGRAAPPRRHQGRRAARRCASGAAVRRRNVGRADRQRHLRRLRAERQRPGGDGLRAERRMPASGTRLFAEVRGQRLPVSVAALPFSPHRYKR